VPLTLLLCVCVCTVQILKLVNAFKDQDCLYLVLEFLQGGDMFGHLYKQGGKFDTPTSVFYAATVLTVFDHLHAQYIVYRDLKPENLVLDSRGFLKVRVFAVASPCLPVCGAVEVVVAVCCGPLYRGVWWLIAKCVGRGARWWILDSQRRFATGPTPCAVHPSTWRLSLCRARVRGLAP